MMSSLVYWEEFTIMWTLKHKTRKIIFKLSNTMLSKTNESLKKIWACKFDRFIFFFIYREKRFLLVLKSICCIFSLRFGKMAVQSYPLKDICA